MGEEIAQNNIQILKRAPKQRDRYPVQQDGLTHNEGLLELSRKLVMLFRLDKFTSGDHILEHLQEGAVRELLAGIGLLDLLLDGLARRAVAVLQVGDGSDDAGLVLDRSAQRLLRRLTSCEAPKDLQARTEGANGVK